MSSYLQIGLAANRIPTRLHKLDGMRHSETLQPGRGFHAGWNTFAEPQVVAACPQVMMTRNLGATGQLALLPPPPAGGGSSGDFGTGSRSKLGLVAASQWVSGDTTASRPTSRLAQFGTDTARAGTLRGGNLAAAEVQQSARSVPGSTFEWH